MTPPEGAILSRKVPSNALSEAKVEEIRRRLEAGETRQAIADAVGCSKSVVNAHAKAMDGEVAGVAPLEVEASPGCAAPPTARTVAEVKARYLAILDQAGEQLLIDPETVAAAVRAANGALSTLDRIDRLDRGKPTAASASERRVGVEVRVVEGPRAPDPLSVLRRLTGST